MTAPSYVGVQREDIPRVALDDGRVRLDLGKIRIIGKIQSDGRRQAEFCGHAELGFQTVIDKPPRRIAVKSMPRAPAGLRQRKARIYFELARRFDTGFDPALSLPATDGELRPPAGLLLMARLHGRPVGCAAVKFHREAPAEVKRMWVAESVRGRGIALEGARGYATLLSPLVAGSLERATGLAEAMEARGFGRGGATRAPRPPWSRRDRIGVVLAVVLVAVAVLWL